MIFEFFGAIILSLGKKANPGKPGDAKSWVYNHGFTVIRIARPPKIAKPCERR